MKGLKVYRPCYKPFLTPDHIRERLAFAKEYQNRTNRFWCNVLFVDEIFLRLHPKDTRLRVRRRRGEKFERRYIQPSFKFGGGGIMFWELLVGEGKDLEDKSKEQ